MLTLSQLIKTNSALRCVTADELAFTAILLQFCARMSRNLLLRWLLPHPLRTETLRMDMLAATLLTVRANDQTSQFSVQISRAMNHDS